MWFNRIISFFTGYVEIVARGAQLEKLINLLTGSGLFLWDIKKIAPEVITAKLRNHGFLMIRPFVRKSGTMVKIYRKRGWPCLRRKIIKRKMFWFGAVLTVGTLLYLSTLTLFIKVDGFSGAEREQLIQTLKRAGLKPGTPTKELFREKRRIERDAIIKTPEAVWLGINFKGVVAEVKVVKRKNPPPPSSGCDLIAERDGLITKVAVIRGRAVVKEGDVVARGDLLISGRLSRIDPETGTVVVENIPASGIVEARVWHDLEVIQPKEVWRAHFLNKQNVVYSIRWGNRTRRIWGNVNRLEGERVWERYRKRIFYGRNPDRVVEFIKDVWQAVRWRKTTLSLDEVKWEALREAKAKQIFLKGLVNGIPNQTWIDEGDFIKLIMTFEMTQDIAMLAPTERRINDRSDTGEKN
ncbi:MAG: sporulation protein YqfD [Firmicutes bacterium]|nr:sporulation protein YqfD [Bacillota bacterium]